MKSFVILAFAFLLLSAYFSLAHSEGTYRLVITVRDINSIPVSEASVRVTTKWGPEDYRDVTPILSTNSSGIVVYQNVYSGDGQAHVFVAKSGIELAQGDYALTAPVTYITVISQGVTSLVVHAVDSSNQSLQSAQVDLDWQGLDGVPWTLSKSTDNHGNAIFEQMSPLTYQVLVSWQGLLVHQGSFDFSETSSNYTAHCNVHDLRIGVFDASNNSLSDAKVTITRSDQWKTSPKYTVEGFVMFPQLAGSNYTINVFYGTYSNVTTIALSSSQTLLIEINLFATQTHDVSVRVIWGDAKPATAANVIVQNNEGATLFTGITNSTGFAFVQLAEGTYNITASKGNAIKTQSINVNDKITITVVLDDAYRISKLTVEVYNQDQFAYGAIVELYSNSHSVCNLTAVDGTVGFDLPDGTYALVVRYQDQQQEATVPLSQDTQLSIIFQVVGEFNSLVVIMAAIVLSIILFVILRSRARSNRRGQFLIIS